MNGATINATVQSGGTVSTTVVQTSTVSSTISSQANVTATVTGGGTGPQGPAGAAGAAGANGANGAPGAPGTPGSTWYNGAGVPSSGTGINGDYYLNTSTGDVYTKSAGACSLTGNIKGPAGSGGLTRSINTISANTSAGAASLTDYVYLASGTITVTLPTAVGNTNQYSIKNTGTGTVTIATTSTQTIDGSTTATISVQNTALTVISDNANWQIV